MNVYCGIILNNDSPFVNVLKIHVQTTRSCIIELHSSASNQFKDYLYIVIIV